MKYSSLRRPRFIITGCLLSGMTVMAACACLLFQYIRNDMLTVNWGPPLQQYTVPENPYFQKIWSRDGFADCTTCIIAADDSIYLVGALQDGGRLSLSRLDLLTGEVYWQTTFSRSNARLLTYSPQLVLVWVSGPGSGWAWDSPRIIAYDRATGKEVWAQRFPGARGVRAAYIIDDKLSVSVIQSRNFQLAVDTGEILEQTRLVGLLVAQNEQLKYLLESGEIQAVDVDTDERLWVQRVPASPLFVEEIIIAGGNSRNLLGSAIALEQQSGNILWEYERVISSIAVNDSTVFFLQMDEDAIWQNGYMSDVHLLAVDLVTGDIIASMQFDPPGITFGSYGHIYKITASSDLVLVHLADGYQLMALRFSPDE
jgi:outer membrane protein assembly factor BamB